MTNSELDETMARLSALLALMSAAGEQGRAAAITRLESDIALWETRDNCEWIVAERRRAIDIIRSQTTMVEQVTPSGE